MINNELKKEFDQYGFCIVHNAFSKSLIKNLLKTTQNILNNEDYSYDLCRTNNSQHIHKIKYMFEKNEIFVKTLVHDAILSILFSLIDDYQNIVPTWEDMLIKIPQFGVPVTVHQDLALQSVQSTVFSLGVYLHDAQHNPVFYLPGSHKLGCLTRDEVYEIYNRQKNDFVPLYAKTGDISVHNVKTLHFSGENKTAHSRYTWYLEFRTREQLLKDSLWDEKWINHRRAIWVYALKKYKKNIQHLIPDEKEIITYTNPLKLRVSHTNDVIKYDMSSPYNHFI